MSAASSAPVRHAGLRRPGGADEVADIAYVVVETEALDAIEDLEGREWVREGSGADLDGAGAGGDELERVPGAGDAAAA